MTNIFQQASGQNHIPNEIRRTYIHPQVLTILATYKCTAACENCCFESNPFLTKRITIDEIISFIKEGLQFQSIKVVVFSGGECFLLGDDLVKAVRFASERGVKTRCVTNGYWATSIEAGRKRLQELKEAGLDELNISTGDFHQKWVSEQSVVNAACLGVEMKLDSTLIVVEAQKERQVTADTVLQNEQLKYLWDSTSRNEFRIIESPWMPRSVDEVIEQSDRLMLSRNNLHLKKGCDNIFNTAVITPDNQVGLCCGLTREQIPELSIPWKKNFLSEHLEEAGKDFIKIWIFIDGPEKILAWAASKNPQIDWENRYAHHCHVCLRIFKDSLVQQTIQKYYKERVNDVLMRYNLILQKQEMIEINTF